ncbi:unnamed protein product [Musa acuminata subsp. burmannicoides]
MPVDQISSSLQSSSIIREVKKEEKLSCCSTVEHQQHAINNVALYISKVECKKKKKER